MTDHTRGTDPTVAPTPARRSGRPRSAHSSLSLFAGMGNEIPLAWAAGFIDGDGCVSALMQTHPRRRSPSIRIRVDVAQNDYYTLKVLADVLGEKHALNPLSRRQYHNRQPFVLTYDGGHAVAVLRKIRSYLVRKAAEANACIELFEQGRLTWLPGPRGIPADLMAYRLKMVEKIRRLK